MSIIKMVKNILFKVLFCFFCNQIFLFDLNPYENYYSSKPTGSVKETLEKISENSWKYMETLGNTLKYIEIH